MTLKALEYELSKLTLAEQFRIMQDILSRIGENLEIDKQQQTKPTLDELLKNMSSTDRHEEQIEGTIGKEGFLGI